MDSTGIKPHHLDPPPPAAEPSLRDRVMRGGVLLVGRQAVGMVVSLVGVIAVTRIIGPGPYGLFTASLAIFTFASLVSRWGVDIYLMRQPEHEVQPDQLHQAVTLLASLGLACTAVGALALPLLQRWVNLDGFAAMTLVYLLVLPVAQVALVPRALLERQLAYDKVAGIELATLVQFHATAVGLALLGLGAWALTLSWVVNQVLAFAAYLVFSGYRPRLRIDRVGFRDMLSFGSGYTASMWTLEMRNLINPLIVAPFAGATAVGYVGMASQLIFRLSVIKSISQQMSVAALARVQDRRERVRELLGEGMQLHVICIGLPVAGFVVVSPWLVPLLLGKEWAPMTRLLPYVGVGAVAGGLFSLHASVLYMYRRTWAVAVWYLALVGLIFTGSALLVPRYGFIGYGYAELLALPAYALAHLLLVRTLGGRSPAYALPLAWSAALGLVMFIDTLGPWALLGVGACALWPLSWWTLHGHVRSVRRVITG